MKANNKKKFKKIKNYLWISRKRTGCSQKQVARILGHKDTTQISKYERGIRIPNLKTALKMQIAYDTPVNTLFRGLYDELQKDVGKRKRALTKAITGDEEDDEIDLQNNTNLNSYPLRRG